MPYHLHAIGADPAEGISYETKALALAAREDGQTISYIATEDERSTWQTRELDRKENKTYAMVPWYSMGWNVPHVNHFAHISLDKPGLIAYTPSDEYGIADRQLRVRPGKYLTDFYADRLSAAEIEQWTEKVRAFDAKLKLARTPKDIQSIYVHGPRSCMGGSHDWSACDGMHPSRVYGDSDLAVAYLGTIEAPTARCVVWPDKKVYTRVYGDNALASILRSAGYECVYDSDIEAPNGPRIRAIELDRGNAWLMPYVDAWHGADREGDYFVLTNDGGDYSVRETAGYIGDESEDETGTCSNCDGECDRDEPYCETCRDAHWECHNCDATSFESDYTTVASRQFCDDCASAMRSECAECNEYWYTFANRRYDEEGDRVLCIAQLQELIDRHIDDRCCDCADGRRGCSECDQSSAIDAMQCESCGHTFRCAETADLLTTETPTGLVAAEPTVIEPDEFGRIWYQQRGRTGPEHTVWFWSGNSSHYAHHVGGMWDLCPSNFTPESMSFQFTPYVQVPKPDDWEYGTNGIRVPANTQTTISNEEDNQCHVAF